MLFRTVVAGAALLALAGCGSSGQPTTTGRSGAPAVDARTVAQRAEDNFIGTTAAHLCNVQSTVYDDTKALAAAYESPPPYPGLDAGQVAAFQQRLATDATFSARLTNQLKATCRPVTR